MTSPTPYHAEHWHKARLDLQGFMVQHRHELPPRLVTEAHSLYGSHDRGRLKLKDESEAQYRTHLKETRPVLARHFCPPWHRFAPEYVATIYSFIEDCKQHLAQRRAA